MRGALHAWERSTVAAVEAGSRALSITEQAALCGVFGRSWIDFLSLEDGEAGLWLQGQLRAPEDVWVRTSPSTAGRWVSVLEALRTGGALEWGGFANVLDADAVAVDETDRKAAKRLGVSAEQIRHTSLSTWGKTLAEMRDELVGDPGDLPARTIQARRGHVTRDLLNHLKNQLEEGSP